MRISVSIREKLRKLLDEKGRTRGFRLLPSYKRDLRSSGILRRVHWYLDADISVHPIGPIYKDGAVNSIFDWFTFEFGAHRLSRLVSNHHSTLRNIPEEGILQNRRIFIQGAPNNTCATIGFCYMRFSVTLALSTYARLSAVSEIRTF
jgi:hypothetical protein